MIDLHPVVQALDRALMDDMIDNVGAAIEDYPEHWDTEDHSDEGRVPASRSWWTEPRWDVGSSGRLELLYLARLLRHWLTHEPRPMDVDRSPLGGCDVHRAAFRESLERGVTPCRGWHARRREVPLTVDQLADALGIIDPEQIDVVRDLVTSRFWSDVTW